VTLAPRLPRGAWLLLAAYAAASLAHHVHNAEYIAFYPGMPGWITRETVYLVWAAVTSVGALGLLLARAGWRSAGLLCLTGYGELGLDGLGHYTLASCLEHTLAMNLTIGAEVTAGAALAVCALALLGRRVAIRRWR
jgi:hypothetical protein